MKKILIVIIAVIVFQKWDAISSVMTPTQASSKGSGEQTVILYATSWCGYCAKARKLLEDNDIAYFEYDVEKSAEGRAQRKQLGGNGVPVLVINGEVVKGYNRPKILALLNKNT